MMDYKVSLGYSRNSYQSILKNFEKFLVGSYPNIDYLTESVVLEWGRQRQTENSSGYSRRLTALREFTKYLNALNPKNYVLPNDYLPRVPRSLPFIFSDKELLDIFKTSDNLAPNLNSPFREITLPVLIRLIYLWFTAK